MSRIWTTLLAAIASGCQFIPTGSLPRDHTPVPPDPNRSYLAKVTRVVSGHTIEVQPNDHPSPQNQTIRLIGIQSPDHAQVPWGPTAQAYLETLLLGQMVQLSLEPEAGEAKTDNPLTAEDLKDTYGRQWAYVWFKSQLVNQQLIAEGIVLVEERSPHLPYVQQFSHAQHRARILGLGIWNPDNPMRQTPREFRQQQD